MGTAAKMAISGTGVSPTLTQWQLLSKFIRINSRARFPWPRDFTSMYTSIPQERLIQKVLQPLREAFQWKSTSANIPFDDLRVDVKYEYNNHATAFFRHKGWSFKDVQDIQEQACTEVYFRQAADGRIFRQSGGLPIGGKAFELANLYCYAI